MSAFRPRTAVDVLAILDGALVDAGNPVMQPLGSSGSSFTTWMEPGLSGSSFTPWGEPTSSGSSFSTWDDAQPDAPSLEGTAQSEIQAAGAPGASPLCIIYGEGCKDTGCGAVGGKCNRYDYTVRTEDTKNVHSFCDCDFPSKWGTVALVGIAAIAIAAAVLFAPEIAAAIALIGKAAAPAAPVLVPAAAAAGS